VSWKGQKYRVLAAVLGGCLPVVSFLGTVAFCETEYQFLCAIFLASLFLTTSIVANLTGLGLQALVVSSLVWAGVFVITYEKLRKVNVQ
jgi:hypothetical protein